MWNLPVNNDDFGDQNIFHRKTHLLIDHSHNMLLLMAWFWPFSDSPHLHLCWIHDFCLKFHSWMVERPWTFISIPLSRMSISIRAESLAKPLAHNSSDVTMKSLKSSTFVSNKVSFFFSNQDSSNCAFHSYKLVYKPFNYTYMYKYSYIPQEPEITLVMCISLQYGLRASPFNWSSWICLRTLQRVDFRVEKSNKIFIQSYSGRIFMMSIHDINGNFRILKWRYLSII